MRRYGIWLATGLVVVVNLVILGGVAWNRSGQPEARMLLSERELRLSGGGTENNGLSLHLVWRHQGDAVQDWFDQKHLEAVGFDCSRVPDSPAAERNYHKQLPRRAYLVLEFDGSLHQRWKEKQLARYRELETATGGSESEKKNREWELKQIKRQLVEESRLFLVDLGKDPRQLRQRYPGTDRYLILPALVKLQIEHATSDQQRLKQKQRLTGYVERILVSRIHLPRDLGVELRRLTSGSGKITPYRDEYGWPYTPADFTKKQPLRYQVDLAVGKRYEPWIRSVQMMSPAVPVKE